MAFQVFQPFLGPRNITVGYNEIKKSKINIGSKILVEADFSFTFSFSLKHLASVHPAGNII